MTRLDFPAAEFPDEASRLRCIKDVQCLSDFEENTQEANNAMWLAVEQDLHGRYPVRLLNASSDDHSLTTDQGDP